MAFEEIIKELKEKRHQALQMGGRNCNLKLTHFNNPILTHP